jgi:hypothetical protein
MTHSTERLLLSASVDTPLVARVGQALGECCAALARPRT